MNDGCRLVPGRLEDADAVDNCVERSVIAHELFPSRLALHPVDIHLYRNGSWEPLLCGLGISNGSDDRMARVHELGTDVAADKSGGANQCSATGLMSG